MYTPYCFAELIPELLEKKPELQSATDCGVIVDGAPVVDEARVDKLRQYIHGKLSAYGSIRRLDIPVDPASGKTKGYLFVVFDSAASAREAVKVANNLRMDRQHILRLCTIQVWYFSANKDSIPSH